MKPFSSHLELAAAVVAVWLWAAGCATPAAPVPAQPRTGFDPAHDVLAYANGLYWEYGTAVAAPPPRRAASGSSGGEPQIFAQRCATMVREVRQFYYGARFDPALPRASEAVYRELLRRVRSSDPRRKSAPENPVVIPGFANLRDFSARYEDLLKEEAGARWRSYLQRGNWRMIFPFGPSQQRSTAESLLAELSRGHPPIVHVVNFPKIDINHTLLLYRAESDAVEVRFVGYDPNDPDREALLRFRREPAAFALEPTTYWAGGPVKAYEVYRGALY
jgi:hypothetical protein